METVRYTFEVFANEDGEMPPDRVRHLFHVMDDVQGNASAPLEYVEPITGGDSRPWGLRAVVIGDD
jgi:hypothetical protein